MASIFYGWWIVLACSAITSYSSGILYYGFTAFFNPLVKEFGWSRAATSLAFGLYRLEGGLAAPLVGFFIDRLGPRKMMTAAVFMMGLGFILLSRINSLGTFYAVFLFIAFSASLGFTPVGNYVAANWFRKKRGTALGVMAGGVSLSGLLVPLLTWLILTWGWRTAAVIAGIGMWIIGLPLSRIIRRRPEECGLLPDGEQPPEDTPATAGTIHAGEVASCEMGYGVLEALRTRSFWLLSISIFILMGTSSALFVHEMPFLISAGIPVETAALVVTGTVLISGVGRVGFGWLSDRFTKRYIMMIGIICQCVGILIFSQIRELWHVIPFIFLFGIGYGGIVPMRAAIQVEYFGTLAFGSIQGILIGSWQASTMLGPVLAGWFFDVTGDYRTVFALMGAAVTAAIPTMLWCKPPRVKRDGHVAQESPP